MAWGTTAQARGHRRRAVALGVLALVVLWPALQRDPSDGFPVSSYPMFAGDRERVVAVAAAVGRTPEGEERRLGPQAIGGGDEVMLAASAIRLAIAGGPAEAGRFCEEVAARVAGDRNDVDRIEIRTEVRDAVTDAAAEAPPESVDVHATCEVP